MLSIKKLEKIADAGSDPKFEQQQPTANATVAQKPQI